MPSFRFLANTSEISRIKETISSYLCIHLFIASAQESEGPFAWRNATFLRRVDDEGCVDQRFPMDSVHVNSPAQPRAPQCLDNKTDETSLELLQAQATALGCIAFKLPKWNALAGKAFSHSVNVIESLFKQHEPLIYKIGVTHDPAWRWSNPIYGYCGERDKWSNMTVFFASDEPYSTGMLEAALIHKYQSILSGYVFSHMFPWVLFYIQSPFFTYSHDMSNPYLPGSAKVGLAVAMFGLEGIL